MICTTVGFFDQRFGVQLVLCDHGIYLRCSNSAVPIDILHGCLADPFYPSPNTFHNLPLRFRQIFAHVKDILVGYLIGSELTPSFKLVGVDDHLGMGLKGYAMLDKLLPLIRRPLELADLYQLGANIFNGVDSTRTQALNVLNELQKLDQGLF
jgi:hypothetical protein